MHIIVFVGRRHFYVDLLCMGGDGEEGCVNICVSVDAACLLSGWGSWGGMGVKAKKKRKEADMAPPTVRTKKPRRDAGMKHVIIAENQISKKLERHLVSPGRLGGIW